MSDRVIMASIQWSCGGLALAMASVWPLQGRAQACEPVSGFGRPENAAIILFLDPPLSADLVANVVDQIDGEESFDAAFDRRALAVLLEARRDVIRGGTALQIQVDRVKAVASVRDLRFNLPWRAATHGTASMAVPIVAPSWAWQHVKADVAATRTPGNHEIRVAIVDSGVDRAHPDMTAAAWENPGECSAIKKVCTIDHVDNDNSGVADDFYGASFDTGNPGTRIDDEFKHGTLVAGIIGGRPSAKWSGGIAAEVTLIPVRVLDLHGKGSSWSVYRGIDYATALKADVINLSLQSDCADETVREAMARATPASALVVAAGNDAAEGRDIDGEQSYPASFRTTTTVVVGATDFIDSKMRISHFGTSTVDLGAPGRQIIAPAPGGHWWTENGTSFATPIVSGGLVLLQSLTSHSGKTWSWRDRLAYLHDSIDAGATPSLRGRFATGGRVDLDRLTAAPVTITSPAAGAVWAVGKKHRLTWDVRFNARRCRQLGVSFSNDGGATFKTIGTGLSRKAGVADVVIGAPSGVMRMRLRLTCDGTGLHADSPPFEVH